MPNLSYQYYKGYYTGFDSLLTNGQQPFNGWKDIKSKDKARAKAIEDFFVTKNQPFKDLRIENSANQLSTISNSTIALKTTYPGLLLGSGYMHGIGAVGEFKIGFHFDYTTGLPIIPGMSVKGVLRSVFPDFKNLENDYILNDDIIDKTRIAWLMALIEKLPESDFLSQDIDPLDIDKVTNSEIQKYIQLTLEIFEGIKSLTEVSSEKKYYTIYHRDIFLDALPIESHHSEGRVMDTDSITPHSQLIKKPTPLLFLKVLPSVSFQFNFKLTDSEIEPNLTKDKKELLFKKILLSIGIGAKTNVGYGQFKTTRIAPAEKNTPLINYERSEEVTKLLKQKTEWTGIIDSIHRENFILKIEVGDETIFLKKKIEKLKGANPIIGSRIKIILLLDATKDNVSFQAELID